MSGAYIPEQIQAFLALIELPSKYSLSPQVPRNLAFLTSLHTHALAAIPYENLSLHYSPQHSNSLDPQALFAKIVQHGRGRGGYCMENSILYNHMLRGLGFDAYTAGVKIRRRLPDGVPAGEYVGWVHIVNLVTLADGTRYMVDVGFGGDGATKPIPLVEDEITANLGTQEVRLVRDHIPSQTHRTSASKMWIYQYRNGTQQAWNSFYAFYDVEFTAPDFGVMNWFTAHNPGSPQLESVLVIKFLRRPRQTVGGSGEGEGEVEDEVYGKRMLVGGVLKENLGGKTVVVETCTTEADRLRVLEESFGITLLEEEKLAIRGWRTELRSSS